VRELRIVSLKDCDGKNTCNPRTFFGSVDATLEQMVQRDPLLPKLAEWKNTVAAWHCLVDESLESSKLVFALLPSSDITHLAPPHHAVRSLDALANLVHVMCAQNVVQPLSCETVDMPPRNIDENEYAV
jgi:hypothetical protein